MFLGESFPLKGMQDTPDETSDDTLSLSDLPLYSNPSFEQWEDDLFDESQAGSTSVSSSETNYFEFFSQELNPPATVVPPENIVFCGKIIPCKGEVSVSKEVEIKKEMSIKKQRSWGVFGWKFSFGRSSRSQVQSKNGDKSTTTSMHKDDHQQPSMKKDNKKLEKGSEFPLHKVPILASRSGKARWHMLLFGISRIPSGVELRDIKSRQSRRQSPPPSPPSRLQSHHDEELGGGTNIGSGIWGLIRVLSCGGNDEPAKMVVGSLNQRRIE